MQTQGPGSLHPDTHDHLRTHSEAHLDWEDALNDLPDPGTIDEAPSDLEAVLRDPQPMGTFAEDHGV